MSYLIKACPHDRFSRTVIQEAPSERLKDKWMIAFRQNRWDVLEVRNVS